MTTTPHERRPEDHTPNGEMANHLLERTEALHEAEGSPKRSGKTHIDLEQRDRKRTKCRPNPRTRGHGQLHDRHPEPFLKREWRKSGWRSTDATTTRPRLTSQRRHGKSRRHGRDNGHDPRSRPPVTAAVDRQSYRRKTGKHSDQLRSRLRKE